MLGGEFAMMQAPLVDGVSFDPFPLEQNGLAAPEVNVGRCEIAQAFVVALMIVVGEGIGAKAVKQPRQSRARPKATLTFKNACTVSIISRYISDFCNTIGQEQTLKLTIS